MNTPQDDLPDGGRGLIRPDDRLWGPDPSARITFERWNPQPVIHPYDRLSDRPRTHPHRREPLRRRPHQDRRTASFPAAPTAPPAADGGGADSADSADNDGFEKLDTGLLTEAAQEIIMASVEDDRQRCADLFAGIGERFGPHGLYVLCRGLAETVMLMSEHLGMINRSAVRGEGFYGFGVFDADTGEMLDPQRLGPELQPMVHGQRFVTGCLNDDDDQTRALFLANPVQVCNGMSLLTGLLGRHICELNTGGKPGTDDSGDG